jgi:hypothetical protein
MSLTFTIGGVAFGAINSDGSSATLARQALSMKTPAWTYSKLRRHPPGTNGNIVVHDGRIGGKIIARFRYLGALSTILGYYKSDREAWADTAVTIIDIAGDSYLSCNLESLTMESDPQGIGGSKAFFVVVATFNYDG